MTAPVIVKAAARFLQEDARRKQRPKLTESEKLELSLDLNTLQGAVPLHTAQARARRGEVAANLIGYEDTFDEVAANVITDILHAAEAHGHDPLTILARARAYYFQESPVVETTDNTIEESS